MALRDKPLASLEASDLEALVTDEVPEGRELEFKQEVGSGDEEKREFLGDSSSFANAVGGDLLIGVREQNGVAVELIGVPRDAADAEILRLESVIRDGVQPRIQGIETRAVALDPGERVVLIMRIPRSYAAPHMVTFKNLSRFYTRNSAGKHQLDVTELRAAFALSESAGATLRSFRVDRLARISAGDTPVPLLANPKVVLHLIPLTAADPIAQIDAAGISSGSSSDHFGPIFTSSSNRRINFDGYLLFSKYPKDQAAHAYTQVFRSGAVEAVEAKMLGGHAQYDEQGIPSIALEASLIQALDGYLTGLDLLGVSPPFLLAVSLLGVRDLKMIVSLNRAFGPDAGIDRNDLIIPELLVDEPQLGAETILRPAFDAIWQAAGWAGSIDYDEKGKWTGR